MKAYISGRISGINLNLARSRFDEAEQLLLSVGFDDVYNPMKHQDCETWHQYMRRDIIELMNCDVIFMLNGWELSKGARIEQSIATQIEMPILYETERRLALNDEIKKIVSKVTYVDVDSIVSKSRKQKCFFARMLCAVLLRECNYSLYNIGEAINRDHATVIYYLKTHGTELDYNSEYRSMYKKAIAEMDRQQLLKIFNHEA